MNIVDRLMAQSADRSMPNKRRWALVTVSRQQKTPGKETSRYQDEHSAPTKSRSGADAAGLADGNDRTAIRCWRRGCGGQNPNHRGA